MYQIYRNLVFVGNIFYCCRQITSHSFPNLLSKYVVLCLKIYFFAFVKYILTNSVNFMFNTYFSHLVTQTNLFLESVIKFFSLVQLCLEYFHNRHY